MALVTTQHATSSTSNRYHVFLSFTGKVFQKTFIDHLYTALVQAGFLTFIHDDDDDDDDETNRGNNLTSQSHKAIQQARIALIVFSKDYASSRRCLEELLMIKGCRWSSGHIVLPIFYDVDPSDVRKQSRSIGEAFARYDEEVRAETDHGRKREWVEKINEWRAVLREFADLAGMVLQNQDDGYESRFIQKIVGVINEKLSRTILHVAGHPVGIYYRVKNIMTWLQDESDNVDILVICGIGGIGKTTIAKFVYNLNFQRFDSSSFLSNIREISEQPRGLVRLQRQLLSNIRKKREEKIYNVDEGIIKITDAIFCQKIIVVLDDVSEVNQLDALLGTRYFYPGSKIIITTRDKWLLKAHEVHKVHVVEELDEDESLELFSWHAFGQEQPTEGYMEQSKRVIHRCGGIPLALEVLGSSLLGKSTDTWESAIKKLEAYPHAQIQKKLEISYESLPDYHDKNLFLHIACFFVGSAKDDTTKILDRCDFFTTVGIENLIDRCLLSIDNENNLRMHQLLQDMGKEIVRRESPKDVGERSRLWHHVDSFYVLKEKRGTKKIEGLMLDMRMFEEDKFARASFNNNNLKKRRHTEFLNNSNQGSSSKRHYFGLFSWHSVHTAFVRSPNEVNLETDTFSKMEQLRLLQLNYVQLVGCYESFPAKLRWLCWHGFPLKSIPIDLALDNLVALDMSYSKLERLWGGTKFLGSLKILNLSYSENLSRTPYFLEIPHVEKLILQGCVSLVKVCESIVLLERLTLLNLEDCKNLRKLPNIGMLKSLEVLIISGCSNVSEYPKELRNMDSLKELQADRFSINPVPISTGDVGWGNSFLSSWVIKSRESPDSFFSSLPHSLVSLSLEECNLSDDSFPMNFSNLSLLRNLNLSKNPIRCLPEWIRKLTSLKELQLDSCKSLQFVLDLPGVETLSLHGSTSVERITSSSLSVTNDISYSKLPEVEEIQGFFKLQPMEKVETEIINDLGLFDLALTDDAEVEFYGFMASRIKKSPIQVLYEFGIFSTFVQGREVPSWFCDRSRGSSLSFTVPSIPNHMIRGLNVCVVYALSNIEDIWIPHPLFTKINNQTKDLSWIYSPASYRIPEANEDLLWLTHWKFGNQLESGDEINVLIANGDAFLVKEFGINIVCSEKIEESQDNDTNSLSWIEIIGGDLSKFQLSTGEYFLSHHGFRGFDFKFADWTTTSWWQKLFSNSVEYEGVSLVALEKALKNVDSFMKN